MSKNKITDLSKYTSAILGILDQLGSARDGPDE
jgi:hypothetical protein